MGRRFRYLPHTADVSFVGYGRTMDEAIESAALALLNVMVDIKRVMKSNGKVDSISIKERATSANELAWFVLQDIVSKVDAMSLNAFEFRVTSLDIKKNVLSGKLMYKETGKDMSLLGVKAVTPHGLEVAEKGGVFSIKVVVDV
ncbi:MAG: archease [Candidatus Micrarchaeota archaeon]|nr:archease [Candidatus Micrarchaeota archaeon]MDE1849917.1 archease [Candidatus Micrarchaeota archaeon]